jgi:hypothetical protein
MSFSAEVMPQKRRLLVTTGLIAAVCEAASAIAAWNSTGAAKALLGGIALFFGLSLFVLSFLRPGGIGRCAFLTNFVVCTIVYGAIFLGLFLFMLGPIAGGTIGLVCAPTVGLVFAIRQTWPLGPWRSKP